MRIVGGRFRGRALAALGAGDGKAQLRPTTDRVRETLFNVLRGYDLPDGARILDLFAGTGALGLEALSRGAVHATFVDDGAKAQSLLKRNIATLDVAAETRMIRRDARKLFAADAPCDLIFLDPPYGRNMGAAALHSARTNGWIAPDALILWEEAQPQDVPEGFVEFERRSYGDTSVQFLGLSQP
ncbi:16S rRNA (guanine(966)-N(2))-methyltransferase RsmD [Pontivivens insulae]|uniref:Ribosomal RNA small subunit methyltransferase D n=1 Tax=Pontivivens insulae TaxID=1639689 RepID=A0A2R8AF25_9RHOB|nr:16S rRNA (guanine(966)-N(2))-methyltransferase RsmD [Pontivivens insulae]RED11952.1 16S rRNA (guanine966-N2)-methyltransferase [Pontivivens insulae]SPF30708.1 Ribosomal RNA small subunit methyltransferase D [Pontivivens insulae]